jgi:hypothetical protein
VDLDVDVAPRNVARVGGRVVVVDDLAAIDLEPPQPQEVGKLLPRLRLLLHVLLHEPGPALETLLRADDAHDRAIDVEVPDDDRPVAERALGQLQVYPAQVEDDVVLADEVGAREADAVRREVQQSLHAQLRVELGGDRGFDLALEVVADEEVRDGERDEQQRQDDRPTPALSQRCRRFDRWIVRTICHPEVLRRI